MSRAMISRHVTAAGLFAIVGAWLPASGSIAVMTFSIPPGGLINYDMGRANRIET